MNAPQPPHWGYRPVQQGPTYGQQPTYGQPPMYGHQPAYGHGPAGGLSGLAVDASYMPLAFLFAFFKPVIVVNGQLVPNTQWGNNVVPLTPGQYHVHVHTPYLIPPRLGSADQTVVVAPGRVTELQYKAPLTTFTRGSLGPAPQKYNGVLPLLAMLGVTFALCVLLLLLT